MQYRYAATSVEGFIQQLASNYLPHGYWFYVSGWLPEGKDPRTLDEKLLVKYGISMSRQSRWRRKAAGFANLQYLRYERFFLLLATHGKHHFFAEEAATIRDVRKVPIKFAGHSISYKPGGFLRKEADAPAEPDSGWHSRVQVDRERYAELKAYFKENACKRSAETLARELFCLPYEPYAPVRQQLLNLLRLINQARHAGNLARVSPEVLRYQRKIVKPFDAITVSRVNKGRDQPHIADIAQTCSA
ncbi:hypothetical protein PLANPX_3790 [Lacipirellula parvula]|uniref:Uncharacterized protein n=1 Tax=Lacipirellula parvula TaxID=2650471 RepID=A0A5K7XCJ4_9BACT|nr:hypothetical protein PLANPX_3790 [Lacipirellula parvula]